MKAENILSMKAHCRNCIALLLSAILLTGCSTVSGKKGDALSKEETAQEVKTSYVTELKVPTVEEVQEINQYVNGLISYGVGPQVEGRPFTEEESLAFGVGDCRLYVYLFVKELSRHGYYQATTYGISSFFIGDDTADHSVVEVKTTEGSYVFDPTHGIYYTADMGTLLSCGNAEEYICGEPSAESYYLTNRFFAEPNQIVVLPDGRNSGDLNLLSWYNASVASSITVEPTQKVVYDESLASNSIVCRFDESVEFYRIEIGFMDELQVPLRVECWSVNDDGTKTPLEGDLVQDVYHLSYQLEDTAEISEIVVEISGRDTLPNLGFFDIYL